MTRGKRQVVEDPPLGVEDADAPLDISTVASLLATEFPLVDPPLIIALLSDHDPSALHSHLDEIRDQLGIIQATLVPDTDDIDTNPVYDRDADEALSELDNKLTRVALSEEHGSSIDQDTSLLLSGTNQSQITRSKASSSTRSRNLQSIGAHSSHISRSTSPSGSRTSHSTSPTSLVESESGFEEDVAYLAALFPTLEDRILQDTLVAEAGVPAAIDHLLSLELIREVEREGHWPGEDDYTDGLGTERPKGSWKISPTKKHAPLPETRLLPSNRDSQTISVIPAPVPSRASKKGKKTIVPLVDTLQRRPTPSASRTSSKPVSRSTSPVRPASAPSSNAWGTISSLADYLSDIIPEKKPAYFLGYFHAPEYHSAYAAVRASLQALPAKKVPGNDASAAVLQDIYGLALVDSGSRQNVLLDVELCARVAGEDVASVMDLMDLLREISEWPGDDDLERYDQIHFAGQSSVTTPLTSAPMSRTSSGQKVQKSAPLKAPVNTERLLTRPKTTKDEQPVERIVVGSRTPASGFASPTAFDAFGTAANYAGASKAKSKSKDRQIHPQNWRTVNHARMRPTRELHPYAAHIPAYARGRLPPDPHSGPSSLHRLGVGSADISECLAAANAERARREEALRAAGRHYRGGGLAGGKAINASVAGHYALQAREAAEKVRTWEMQAARLVVSRQLDTSGHTLDLHHMTIDEATTVACEAATTWYARQKAAMDRGAGGSSRNKAGTFEPPRGLTVIVGVGRHSAGQKGVLGPAVASALEGSGWRVDRGDNGRGYLVVRGKK